MTTTRRHAALVSLLLAAIALTAAAGCAGTTTTTHHSPAATHTAAKTAVTSSAAPSPSPSPSPVACTDRSCIVYDASQMVGNAASDGSVITKMSCDQSTVRHQAPGVWSVNCTATYSDGSRWAGIATVLTSKNQVSWEPQYQV